MTIPKGAELGETNDPKALILGDKAAVAEFATTFLDEQRRIGEVLESIEGLAVPTWQGGFGKAGYTYKKGKEAEAIETYRDTLKDAGTILNSYSDALGTAQDRAQEAIDKWNEGEATTKKALADHNAAVDGYNRQVDAHNAAIKSGQTTIPLIGYVHPGPFVDPGEDLRTEAKEILADAREQLNDAGGSAIKPKPSWAGLNTEAEADVTRGGVLGALGKILGGIFDTEADDLATSGLSGELKGFEISPDGKEIQLFDANGEVHEFRIEGNLKGQVGDIKLEADGSLTLNSVSGEAVGKIDEDGLHLGVGIHQRTIEVEGSLSMRDGYLTMGGNAYAYIGTDAEAKLNVGREGVEAGFDVASGAKAGIDGSLNYGGIGIGFAAEGQTGTGAAGGAEYGWKDGKFTFGFEAGLADGVGGKIRPTVELDFPEIGRTAQGIVANPDDAARELAGTAGDIGKVVGQGAQWVAENPRDAAEAAVHGALAQPKASIDAGRWALAHPDEAAELADSVFSNPIEQYHNAKQAIERADEIISRHPEAIASGIDKITVDADEAKNAAKGVLNAVGGLF